MTAHLHSAARAFEAALPDPPTNRNIARMFHEAYERLAPEFGYRTREASAVPWEKVPAKNRDLMTATVGKVRSALAAALPDERLREAGDAMAAWIRDNTCGSECGDNCEAGANALARWDNTLAALAAADRDKPDGCRAPHCFSEYGTPCGTCPVLAASADKGWSPGIDDPEPPALGDIDTGEGWYQT